MKNLVRGAFKIEIKTAIFGKISKNGWGVQNLGGEFPSFIWKLAQGGGLDLGLNLFTPKSISLPITHKICFYKNLIVPNFLPRGGRNFILLCSQLHGVPNFFYLFFILKSPISRPLVYEILFPQLKYMLT